VQSVKVMPRRDAQTKMASFNFVEPYLRSVFGFLGVTDAAFLTAGGTGVLNQGHDRDAFLEPHLQAVQTHAQTSQGGHA
jgi:FMN-dependent NADH-azoreductase